jgi:hypothetical protein
MEKYVKIVLQAEYRENGVPYYIETNFRKCKVDDFR